jgi:uncharacterized protein
MATHDDEVRAQTLKLAESYQALLMQQRWDEWIELWADDGICELPYSPQGGPRLLQGKDAILAHMSSYPGKMAIDEVTDARVYPMLDPEIAAIEFAIKGRALTTGRPYNQRYVVMVETRTARIWRYREYSNPEVFVEAFGTSDSWLSAHEKSS